MKSMILLVLMLGLLFATSLAFQLSTALRVPGVSRVMCAEVPESCTDGIDEMIETATIIKEEVCESGLRGCHTLSSQMSSSASEFGQVQKVTHRAKFVRKPTTMRRKAAERS